MDVTWTRVRRHACVQDSTFVRADFDGVTMGNVALQRCNLRGATFRGAMLAEGKLQEIDGRDADFSRSILSTADFTGAQLDRASFVRVAALFSNH